MAQGKKLMFNSSKIGVYLFIISASLHSITANTIKTIFKWNVMEMEKNHPRWLYNEEFLLSRQKIPYTRKTYGYFVGVSTMWKIAQSGDKLPCDKLILYVPYLPPTHESIT